MGESTQQGTRDPSLKDTVGALDHAKRKNRVQEHKVELEGPELPKERALRNGLSRPKELEGIKGEWIAVLGS